MRSFILILYFVLNLYYGFAKVIPDRLPKPCSKSIPNYNECTLDFMRKFQPYMLNGIREMNIPNFNPFYLPVFSVNRTINDMVSIAADITDIKIWGFDKMEIKSFKLDPETLNGEAEVYLPSVRLSLNYNASGKLLGPSPLTDAGHLKGNLSDVNGKEIFGLSTTEKMGIKYLTLENVKLSGNVGGANIKMISKNAENQGVADFISNFFNEDPKRTLTTLAPVIEDTAETVAKLIADQILSRVPADELIPE